jgi:hypothetical protein
MSLAKNDFSILGGFGFEVPPVSARFSRFELLPSMLKTLQEMPWVLPAYKPDGMEFVGRLLSDLGLMPPRKDKSP